MTRDLVWIKTLPDEAEASRVRELLRAGGIESIVSGDRSEAYRVPPLPAGYRIGVRANDLRAALNLVWNKPSG